MNIGGIVRKATSALNKRKTGGGHMKTKPGSHGHTKPHSTEDKAKKAVKRATKKL